MLIIGLIFWVAQRPNCLKFYHHKKKIIAELTIDDVHCVHNYKPTEQIDYSLNGKQRKVDGKLIALYFDEYKSADENSGWDSNAPLHIWITYNANSYYKQIDYKWPNFEIFRDKIFSK